MKIRERAVRTAVYTPDNTLIFIDNMYKAEASLVPNRKHKRTSTASTDGASTREPAVVSRTQRPTRAQTHLRAWRKRVKTLGSQLTSSRSPHKSQVVESGGLVLEQGTVVAQIGRAVLVVSRRQHDLRAVWHIAEGQHFEGNGESFVATPVRRKDRADEVWAVRADQFPGVFC